MPMGEIPRPGLEDIAEKGALEPLSFSEAIDSLNSALAKEQLDESDRDRIQAIEHSLLENANKYSEEIRREKNKADFRELLNNNIAYFNSLGDRLKQVIDSSDRSYSVDLYRIMAALNGPRMDFERQLARMDYVKPEVPKLEDDTGEAA